MDDFSKKKKYSRLLFLNLCAIVALNCSNAGDLIGNSKLEKELGESRTIALLGLLKPSDVVYLPSPDGDDTNVSNVNPEPNTSVTIEPPLPPLKNIWSSLTNVPRRYVHSASGTIGNRVFIFAPYSEAGNITDGNAHSFNMVTYQWTKLKNMPGPRTGSSSATIGNKIYIFGGWEYVYEFINDPPPYCVNQVLWHCFEWIDPPPVYGNRPYPRANTYIYDTTTDTWTIGAPMRQSYPHHQAIAVGGKVYLFGNSAVDVYDPVANQWQNIQTNTPISSANALTEMNGKIYSFGGIVIGTGDRNRVFEFDPVNLTWTPKTNIPTPRAYAVSTVYEGKIYVMGGLGNSDGRVVEVFDPVANSWTVRTPLPEGAFLIRGIGAQANGKFFAIGGMNSILSYYDLENNTSTQINVLMNTARNYFASTVYDGKYYVFGGFNGSALSGIEVLDLGSYNWTTAGNLPSPKFAQKAAVLSNKIYIVGGNNGSSTLNTVDVFDPETGTFSTAAPLQTPRQHHSLCVNAGKLYAVGGSNTQSGGILNSVEEYDPETNQWVYRRTMSSARSQTACIFHNEEMYVFGGYDGSYITTVESYNPSADSWSLRKPMSFPRGLFEVVKLRDRIYAVGGHNNSTTTAQVEKYFPHLEQWVPEYSMNSPRYGHSVIAPDNNRMIVVGGHNGSVYLRSSEEFY